MNYTAFLSYAILCTFTPGPNNIMAMSNAAKYGFLPSLPFNAGVFAGFILIQSAAALCSALLYDMIPTVKPYMLTAGALYILWLAWHILRSASSVNDDKKASRTNTFAAGFMLQFVNVKVILYSVTAMSSFVLPAFRSISIVELFALLLSALALCSTLLWAVCGSVFERLFKEHTKALNAVMALLLLYCAISMAAELF